MTETTTPAPSSSSEVKLWQGNSSQWIHFWFYALCVVLAIGVVVLTFMMPPALALMLIPVAMWFWRWWLTKTTVFTLTNERLLVTRGIITRHQDNLELYRVRDYCVKQPILLRMLGLGNLELLTSDTMTPNVVISAIRDVEGVREKLRTSVESARDRKRVRQMDVETSDVDAMIGDDQGHHS
ncbi:MAG: PH domain-containing protein [Verrucomicrobia bacterium]|nr:PH domain-containing protein [Verrucomicrobiota bacterium]